MIITHSIIYTDIANNVLLFTILQIIFNPKFI